MSMNVTLTCFYYIFAFLLYLFIFFSFLFNLSFTSPHHFFKITFASNFDDFYDTVRCGMLKRKRETSIFISTRTSRNPRSRLSVVYRERESSSPLFLPRFPFLPPPRRRLAYECTRPCHAPLNVATTKSGIVPG